MEFDLELRYPPSLDQRLIVMDASLMLVLEISFANIIPLYHDQGVQC